MRTIRWVPLTFLAGLHGFALFAPYVALVAGIWIVMRARRATALAGA
jgi:hypothetical protein